jgi:hypothetical protein
MNTPHNPTASSSASIPNSHSNGNSVARRWPKILVNIAACYYLLSALTLPFVNKFWLGEIPVLALIQLPKSFLKSAIHTPMMSAMHSLGYSHGSFSPDYGATHGWAMAIMVTLPALFIVAVLWKLRKLPQRRTLIVAVLVCASIDAVVTLWFDSVSHLKLFNAMFF